MKRYKFLIYVIIVFIAFDIILSAADPVGQLDLFLKNDFEKILLENGTREYDKIFYGNSAVISAYIEEQSDSGYTNFGIDYGTAEDLLAILKRGLITVKSDIVIGLNYFTLLDTLETNETYPWHKKVYQPYAYFQRDRLSRFLSGNIETFLQYGRFSDYRNNDYSRTVYSGLLSHDELREKITGFETRYFSGGLSAHYKNLSAIEQIIKFCKENDIRLGIVWMPWNPVIEIPDLVTQLMADTNEIFARHGIGVYDVTSSIPPEHFHDIGHLNYETGAPFFTKEADVWLSKD